MHLSAVTFAFTMPRPEKSWRGMFDVQRAALERAAIQGIRNIAFSRIDARWHPNHDGVEHWHPPHFLHRSRLNKKSPLIPKGHIAVLVEGFAEKE